MNDPNGDDQEGSGRIDRNLLKLIEGAPIAVAMFDPDMRYVAWSTLWSDRYASDDRDLKGVSLFDLSPDLSEQFLSVHQQALAGQCAVFDASRVETAEGKSGWKRWHLQPVIEEDGSVVGIAIYNELLGEHLESEDDLSDYETSLRKMIDALGVGIIEKNFETGKTTVSPGLLRLIGLDEYSEPDDLDGWLDVLQPMDSEIFRKAKAHAFDPDSQSVIMADLQPIVAGKKRAMQLVGRVLFSDDGEPKVPARFIGILIDETERRALHASLAQSMRLETVGQLTGVIAHDINNLLSVILANLELAAMRLTDPATIDLLKCAIDAAETGGSFNKKLLALSSNNVRNLQSVDLDQHLLKIWAMLERMLQEQISLHFVPGANDHHVYIDPAELDGAVLNLVLNARDAQPQGGKIVIATREVEINEEEAATYQYGKAGRFLELSVTDHGVGMSKAEVARAQEPFFSSKASNLGTGLGLTSVLNSVTNAGGFMEIQSDPGHGTTVFLFLPVHATTPQHCAPQGEMPLGDGALVLVVEDDAMVREATLKRLEALGYAVIEAADGQSALGMLEEGEQVDLVFSDVVMPGQFSGYDLVREIRHRFPNIAVLLTSGHISMRIKHDQMEDTTVELLTKPYSLPVLARAVERALKPAGEPA